MSTATTTAAQALAIIISTAKKQDNPADYIYTYQDDIDEIDRLHRKDPAVKAQLNIISTMKENTMNAPATNAEVIANHAERARQQILASAGLSIDGGGDQSQSDKHQDYFLKGMQFVGANLAGAYVRAKLAIIAPSVGAPMPTAETVEACKEKAREFNYWREFTGLDIVASEVADNICGLTGRTEPSEREISEMADAHGISFSDAADMIRARKVAYLSHAQRKNLHKHGSIISYLSDIEKFGSECQDSAGVEKKVADAVVKAYENAGKFASLEGRYVVESFARQWGITLPAWADVLPKWTAASAHELEKVQRVQTEVADARAKEQAEAERDIVDQFGEF